ncbi:MAG: baseplate J/gp47 family protein [Burkholderiales bacterium]
MALTDNYIRADERGLPEFIRSGVTFAKQLAFFDSSNLPAGDWGEWFDRNEALILARIAGIDVERFGERFLNAAEGGLNLMAPVFRELALEVGELREALDQTRGATCMAVIGEIDRLVLGDPIHGELAKLLGGTQERDATALFREVLARLGIADPAAGGRKILFSLLHATGQLKELAAKHFAASLANDSHEPAAALFIAFLQLLGVYQRRLNAFLPRHTDFYYRECLHMQPRQWEPDSVHLVFERAAISNLDVMVSKNAAFVLRNADGREIVYRANENLEVTSVRVAALHTLRLERDPLVFTESALKYITCAKAERLPAEALKISVEPARSYWPLFGGAGHPEAAIEGRDAEFGMVIASPLFFLHEGEREIHVRLVVASRNSPGEDLNSAHSSAEALEARFDSDFFKDLFEFGLTAPDGWHFPQDAFVSRVASRDSAGAPEFEISIRLPLEAPPIVSHDAGMHGGGWSTASPALRIRLKTGGTRFAYSMLSGVVLGAIHVDVCVRGAKDVILYNDLGRLDPSKAFQPFGPLPARGSHLVFGSPEAARKRLTHLALNVEWGGVPEDSCGFPGHYAGYEKNFGNQDFKVAFSVLCSGEWEPRSNPATLALFPAAPDDGRVASRSTLSVESVSLRNYFRPTHGAAPEDLHYDLSARSGFFRLTLAEPAEAFGHAQYPHLLSATLAGNAKRRRPLRLPNAPYTPRIERLTIDYRASESIDLAQKPSVGRELAQNQLFHIHPYGFEEIYPAPGASSKGPIPKYDRDGNLFIGLTADHSPGRISLLFNLRDESARADSGDSPAPGVTWFYLASNRWHPLPKEGVLVDSTYGFLTSGIVTLDIPDNIDRSNTILSADFFWLRVSVDSGFEHFAGLCSVHAQALCATREHAHAVDLPVAPPGPGAMAQLAVSIPGLANVVQVGSAFGGRAAEDAEQFKARAGERLRHKNRASTAWDYERLVLERFPEVHRVKCFPTVAARSSARPEVTLITRPGCVTVAVVPTLRSAEEAFLTPKLNAVDLQRIREYLEERASEFAEIAVRNAIYERVQVRCAVRFKKGVHNGSGLRKLNDDLVKRISPWRIGGAEAGFNWNLRNEDIETWIRDFDYVEAVSKVSLLQITEGDDGYFVLGDSARAAATGSVPSASSANVAKSQVRMRPRFPWSIAIPARNHAIELMDVAEEAHATGIDGLEIGASFIVAETCDG